MSAQGLLVAVATIVFGYWLILPKRKEKRAIEVPKDTVLLHGFPVQAGRKYPDPSPFVAKVEVLLKVANVPFIKVPGFRVKKSPVRKLPWIKYNDTVIGDSSLISEWISKEFKNIDADLTVEQLAVSHAFQKYVEEYLFYIGLYLRYFDEKDYESTFAEQFDPFLGWRSFLLKGSIRAGMINRLNGQGLAYHKRSDIIKYGKQVIDDISVFLGRKTYFMGLEHMTTIDATIFGLLINALYYNGGSRALSLYVKEKKNLVDYCERIREKHFQTASEASE